VKEQVITLETAKLAKEVKLRYPHKSWYDSPHLAKPEVVLNNSKHDDDMYPAPTQSLLQKWLRDKHNIHVIPVSGEHGLPHYDFCCMFYNGHWFNASQEVSDYDSYEEALEDGLQTALEFIKLNK